MTIWEFRRKVRLMRGYLDRCCPLGAALQGHPFRNPLPTFASETLGLPWGYCVGLIAGFDLHQLPETDLPGSTVFDAGFRFGRRMRSLAQ